MDSAGGELSPEGWADVPVVKELLFQILGNPLADHATPVAMQLSGGLLDGHVAGLVRFIESASASARKSSAQFDSGVALHTVLYHLLGGTASGLRPPPGSHDRQAIRSCTPGWSAATKAKTKFYSQLKDAVSKSKKGDHVDLRRIRSTVFDPTKHSNLKLASADVDTTTTAASVAATAASPPAPPPPGSPADIERERRRSCCLMLARGTHARYGLFSLVRKLVGNRDMLERIAMLADINMAVYIPSPPPPERIELHRLLRAQLSVINEQRGQIDALQSANQKL